MEDITVSLDDIHDCCVQHGLCTLPELVAYCTYSDELLPVYWWRKIRRSRKFQDDVMCVLDRVSEELCMGA